MLTNMTSQTNRETSSVIVRAVCAHVCAGRRYNSLTRNKGYWVGSTYFRRKVHRSIDDIYGCLGERYFRRAYRMLYESFWLLHRKLCYLWKDMEIINIEEGRALNLWLIGLCF